MDGQDMLSCRTEIAHQLISLISMNETLPITHAHSFIMNGVSEIDSKVSELIYM